MRVSRHWRLLVLCLIFIVPLTGLLAASIAGPDVRRKETKREPSFPQRLFDQAKAEDYLDENLCVECHGDSHKSWNRSPHALFVNDPHKPIDRRGCQSCHGPGGPHISHLKDEDHPYDYIISYTRVKPEEGAAACLRCHTDTLTTAHWRRTGHARAGVGCTACHQMHWPDRLGRNREKPRPEDEKPSAKPEQPRANQSVRNPIYTAAPEPKALLKADEATLCGACHRKESSEFRNNFHHPVPEGRMVCSDCHEVHANREQHTQLRTHKSNCVTCHPDVAGPFVYEHEPTSDLGGQGCLDCHKPHGSHNPSLLNTFSRGQCNQCHSDKAVNHYPGRSCWQSGCHVAVHGSNHDKHLFSR